MYRISHQRPNNISLFLTREPTKQHCFSGLLVISFVFNRTVDFSYRPVPYIQIRAGMTVISFFESVIHPNVVMTAIHRCPFTTALRKKRTLHRYAPNWRMSKFNFGIPIYAYVKPSSSDFEKPDRTTNQP